MSPDLIETAVTVAEIAHRGQFDKNGEPYLNHPIAVADLLPAEDIEGRVTALLHDVLEDSDMTPGVLSWMGIPAHIVDAVVDLTHAPMEPLETYWLRIRLNPLALRVKAADIEHNMDVKRMAKLDYDTRTRLMDKYNRAREFLGLNER